MIKHLIIIISIVGLFGNSCILDKNKKKDTDKDKRIVIENKEIKNKNKSNTDDNDNKKNTDKKNTDKNIDNNKNTDTDTDTNNTEIKVTIDDEVTYQNYLSFANILKKSDISKIDINDKLTKTVELLYHTEEFDTLIELLDSFSDKTLFSDSVKKISEKFQEVKIVENHKIGVILPKKGRYKRLAVDIENGLILAKKQLKGEFTFVIKETDGSTDMTRKATEDLIFKEHVVAIIGTIKSSSSKEVANITNSYKIPFISLSKNYEIANLGKYVFNYFAGADDITDYLAKYSVEVLKIKHFGIFYPNSGYGNRNMTKFWEAVKKYGGKVTAIQMYPPNKGNSVYIAPAEKLVGKYYLNLRADYLKKKRKIIKTRSGYARKKALESLQKELLPIIDFDALFIPESASITTLLLPYLALYDITFNTGDYWQNKLAAMKAKDKNYTLKFVQLLGISTWNTTSILDGAGKYAKGALFPVFYDKNIQNKDIQNFTTKYRETFNKKASLYSLLGYEVIEIISEILKKSESNNTLREKITETLLLNNFKTLSGQVSFNSDGNAKIPLYLMKFTSDNYKDITKKEKEK